MRERYEALTLVLVCGNCRPAEDCPKVSTWTDGPLGLDPHVPSRYSSMTCSSTQQERLSPQSLHWTSKTIARILVNFPVRHMSWHSVLSAITRVRNDEIACSTDAHPGAGSSRSSKRVIPPFEVPHRLPNPHVPKAIDRTKASNVRLQPFRTHSGLNQRDPASKES